MPPRGGGGGGGGAALGASMTFSDPMYIGNLWAMVQMVMARGCMPEDEAQKEFARITGKPAADLFQQAFDRENHELGRLQLVLRRVRSPATGALHVGVANLSSDAPAKAVGSRYSHAQREFFARVLEAIATDPNASNGICSMPVPRLLNLDLSLPSSIGSTAAAAAAAEAAATRAPGRGGGGAGGAGGKKGRSKTAVKRNPHSSDDGDDATGDGDDDAKAAAREADEDARKEAAEAAARLAAAAVARMSMKEREETLAQLAADGWLEARSDVSGHYCIGPRSFIELMGYLLRMDIQDDTREVWERMM